MRSWRDESWQLMSSLAVFGVIDELAGAGVAVGGEPFCTVLGRGPDFFSASCSVFWSKISEDLHCDDST